MKLLRLWGYQKRFLMVYTSLEHISKLILIGKTFCCWILQPKETTNETEKTWFQKKKTKHVLPTNETDKTCFLRTPGNYAKRCALMH